MPRHNLRDPIDSSTRYEYEEEYEHEICARRRAMRFAVAGLRAPGIVIENPECVGKTFPSFWERLESLG